MRLHWRFLKPDTSRSLLTAEAPRADLTPVAGLGHLTRSPMLSGILQAGRQGQRQFVCNAVSPSRRHMVSWQSLLDRYFGLHINIWIFFFKFIMRSAVSCGFSAICVSIHMELNHNRATVILRSEIVCGSCPVLNCAVGIELTHVLND